MLLLSLAAIVPACDEYPLPFAFPGRLLVVEPEQVLGPNLLANAVASCAPPFGVRGSIRVLHGTTSCQATGGVNPSVKPVWREPRANAPIDVTWSTRSCPTPPAPDEAAWLLVSLRPLEVPLNLSMWNAPGCSLLVNPDYLMMPSTSPNSLLQRHVGTGMFTMHWIPDPGFVGHRVWAQLLVYAPGQTPGNYLLSPAIEVLIGSQLD
jgi:hypothetical protein